MKDLDNEGNFKARFPGTEEHRGLVMWAQMDNRVFLGLVPNLPRQPTVFHEEHHLYTWKMHPTLADLNEVSTAAALVMIRSAVLSGQPIEALNAAAITDGLDQFVTLAAQPDDPCRKFTQHVALISSTDVTWDEGPYRFDKEGQIVATESWFEAALAQHASFSLNANAFNAALDAAAERISLKVCYPPNRIRVIFRVQLQEGAINANCAPINPYKWASNLPGKRVFITGGVHEDTPICAGEAETTCLTEAQVDAINQQLGNWVPNQMAMTDNGQSGDRQAGDGIWSAVFEFPYFDPDTGPGGAGIRLAYKYTFGLPGQGWTDAEEWPGNQRLLELADLNHDRLVVRLDIFGDEAANKDKVNALKPALGGCGTMAWWADAIEGCASDTRENRVDTDGDCKADSWVTPQPNVPLVIPCP
jgi:hypothetical protein